jgi:hypothetical protein
MNAIRSVMLTSSFATYNSESQKQCAKYHMKAEEINRDESKKGNADSLIFSSILGYSCSRSS